MHIEEDASTMSTVSFFYFTAMYKCASTHCTSAKIAPQKMSGHSVAHSCPAACVTHSHTHENFGNDDMYSTFVHSQQTNDAGSCNFNLSQILWKQHSKAPMFEQPLFKMAFFFFNGSLNSKDRAFPRMQKGSSSLKLFTNGLEIPCMHMHVHMVEHPCIASAV